MLISILVCSLSWAGPRAIYPSLYFPSPVYPEPITIDKLCISKDGLAFEVKKPIKICVQPLTVKMACKLGEAEYCRDLKSQESPLRGEYLKSEYRCLKRQLGKPKRIERIDNFVTACTDLRVVGHGEGAYLKCFSHFTYRTPLLNRFPYQVLSLGQAEQYGIRTEYMSLDTCQ